MNSGQGEAARFPGFVLSLALWVVFAVLAGSALALTGVGGLFSIVAVALMVIFGAFAAKHPVYAMGLGICSLGLFPFTWGLQAGGFTVFADESVLVLYVLTFPFLYVFTDRVWQPGFRNLYIALTVLVVALSLSLSASLSIFSIRTFLSTFGLGVVLLVLYLQEASNSDPEEVGRFVVWTTVIIAALSVVERIVQRNPFVEHTPLYISAEIVRINNASYRPYVSFFHPSEAGAFMALGSPFVFSAWLRRRSWLSLLGVVTLAMALVINATRGVWAGLFLAALVAIWGVRKLWLWISALVPLAVIGGLAAFLTMRNTPFFQRLSDPTDLYERFHTWEVAIGLVMGRPLLGVGVGNFVKAYSVFMGDSKGVFTADNMFVSILAENGLVGFISFVVFLVLSWTLLRRYRQKLDVSGLTPRLSFVRCVELALVCYVCTGCFADIQAFRKLTKFVFILIGLGLAEGVRALRLVGATSAEQVPSENSTGDDVPVAPSTRIYSVTT